ncbi:MAG: hypothetical protein J7549_15115 [Variovorax sp.]|nr:hypothetical protein [Variovorax sp.]
MPVSGAAVRVREPVADEAVRSGVSWPAIFAGATAAAALSLIMLLLGAGMGLGLSSPWEGEGAEARTIGIAGAFWIMFTQVVASGLGGYLAGRLRTKWSGLRTDEVKFRDTAHGFLAWGLATLVTSALIASIAGSALGATARAGMQAAGSVASVAASGAAGLGAASSTRSGEAGGGGPMGYWVDSLLRRDPGAPAGAPAAEASGPGSGTAELGGILANAMRTGSLSPEDTRYAGQIVAQRTGLSQQDAEKRVNDTFARAKAALEDTKNKAKAAADAARKASAYASLWIFISLVVGALVAAYCASLGGRGRDL